MTTQAPAQQGQQQQEGMKPPPAPPPGHAFFQLMRDGIPAEPNQVRGYAAGGIVGFDPLGEFGLLDPLGELGDTGGYDPAPVDMANIRPVAPTKANVPRGNMWLHETKDPKGDPTLAQDLNFEPPDGSVGGIPIPGSGTVGDFNPDDYLRWGTGPEETLGYVGKVGRAAIGKGMDWAKTGPLTNLRDIINRQQQTAENAEVVGEIPEGFNSDQAQSYELTGSGEPIGDAFAWEPENDFMNPDAPDRAFLDVDAQQPASQMEDLGGDESTTSQADIESSISDAMFNSEVDDFMEVFGTEDAAIDVDPSFEFGNVNWDGLAMSGGVQAALGILSGAELEDVVAQTAVTHGAKAAAQLMNLGSAAGPIGTIASELYSGPGKGSMANIGASAAGALLPGALGMGAGLAATGVGLIPAGLVFAHNMLTRKTPTTRSIQRKEYGRANRLINEAKSLLGSNYQAPPQDLMNRFTAAGQDMTSHDSRGTTASEMINFLEKQLRDQYGTHNVAQAQVLKDDIDVLDTDIFNFDEEGGLTNAQEKLQNLRAGELEQLRVQAETRAAEQVQVQQRLAAQKAEEARQAQIAGDRVKAENLRLEAERAKKAQAEAAYAAERRALEERMREAEQNDDWDFDASNRLRQLKYATMTEEEIWELEDPGD